MKKLLVIGTFTKDEDSEELIKSALKPLVSEFDVCLVTHSPVSRELQSMVKYHIYDHRNEMIPNSPTFHIWADCHSFYFQSHHVAGIPNHSYAIYRSYTNAVLLLKDYYDDFFYVEGDCVFSKEDVDKLKEFSTICERENKEALFFTEPDMLHTLFFYSKMDFFVNTFPLLKTADDYINYCEKIGSWRSLENFMLRCAINKNVLEKIYDAGTKNGYFSNSKMNIVSFDGTNDNKSPPYDSHVVCVENTEEIAFIYLCWKDDFKEDMDVFLDEEKIYTAPAGPHMNAIKINPKNEYFQIKIGKWPAKVYRIGDILKSKSIDFVRYK